LSPYNLQLPPNRDGLRWHYSNVNVPLSSPVKRTA